MKGSTVLRIRILGAVADGETDRDIAKALYMTPAAVQYHVRCLKRETGTTSRPELVRAAQDLGLVRPRKPARAAAPALSRVPTARRIQVLRLLAQGESYERAGELLDISVHTVKTHMKALFFSLQVPDAAAAVALCHAHGLLQAPQRELDLPARRRMQTLVRVARGRSNDQIARDLGVSIDTVKAHLRWLMRAAGAVNRANLVHLAFGAGWLRVPANTTTEEGT